MLKVLIKKQLSEVFKSYFYDSKNNRARSKKSTVSLFVFFIVLMVFIIGGSFAALSVGMCMGMTGVGLDWMYFSMMGLLAMAFGIFGSVFNTFSGLYLSKDNDLLLSMPIPVGTIIASRLLNVYIMALIYASSVFIPASVVYHGHAIMSGTFSVMTLIGSLLMYIEISLLDLALSCLLGWVVAKISLKLKNKGIVTVLISLVGLGIYYFCYFKANAFFTELISNASHYEGMVKKYAYILYIFGNGAIGKPIEMLICFVTTGGVLAVTWLILSKSFLKIATATGAVASSKGKTNRAKSSTISGALLKKEFGRFTGSSNYMLNCGLGILLIPAMGVLLLVKGPGLLSALNEALSANINFVPIIVCVFICLVAGMVDTSAPSVSLEGKNLWIVQSIPVDMKKVLKAKFNMQLILVSVPMAIYMILAIIAMKLDIPTTLCCLVFAGSYIILTDSFGLMLGTKFANFSWTSEIKPIKQSLPVTLAFFGSWGYGLVFAVPFFFLGFFVPANLYVLFFSVVNIVLDVVFIKWIKKSGAKIMENY